MRGASCSTWLSCSSRTCSYTVTLNFTVGGEFIGNMLPVDLQ